ncbi:MAG TPA: redoxin domain-containing protein [Terriglobia bacterium]|nr:redoxin domain-containing protein [Terriglobia bacterium]
MRKGQILAGCCAFLLIALPTCSAQELITLHVKAPEFPSAEPILAQPTAGNVPIAPAQGAGSRPATAGAPNESPNLPAAGASVVTWIDSAPLTMQRLRGKVVMIDFWEYTCINCIRTFADNKKWHERYHKYGFEIIGVHDPEFDVAYPVEHVRAAVKRFGLPYPVVVDDNFEIWKSYHNSTWPNRFLIDANGFIRFDRPGEGADSAFEHAIQELLVEAHPGLKFPASYKIPPDENVFAESCGSPTPEMYVGNWYGRGILSNLEGYHEGKTLEYELPGSVDDGRVAVAGRWETDKNGMIYRGKSKGVSTDQLEMRYHARELYAVLNVEHGHPERLYIKQDGKDLTVKDKGVDVAIDPSGHSYLEVREPRMYYLVQNPAFGSHLVQLFPTRSGVTINSFTFGNSCQTDFPHL